jgi:hypothetical protein
MLCVSGNAVCCPGKLACRSVQSVAAADIASTMAVVLEGKTAAARMMSTEVRSHMVHQVHADHVLDIQRAATALASITHACVRTHDIAWTSCMQLLF